MGKPRVGKPRVGSRGLETELVLRGGVGWCLVFKEPGYSGGAEMRVGKPRVAA